jgi:pimeloyl-ACP methyl ester carboxylesterase
VNANRKNVPFRGGNLSYTLCGQGPDVLLVHGFPESSAIWEDYSRHLSDEYRVICIDLPGHGGSSVFGLEHTMEFMAEAVLHILDTEKSKECIMVGHSMGGYVSLAFASAYPGRLRGLVLFHSQAGADDETAKQNRLRAIEIVEGNKAGFLNSFIPGLFAPENEEKFREEINKLMDVANNTPSAGIIAAIRGMMNRKDRQDVLQDLVVPVAFITGMLDTRIPPEKIKSQIFIPQYCEVLILGKTAHMGFLEDADNVLMFLKSFIERAFNKI